MSQRKIFNVLIENSTLRPQHQQHNKVSNSKCGSTSTYKGLRNKENKTYNYPHPVTYQSMTANTTRGINSHQRLLLVICTLPT